MQNLFDRTGRLIGWMQTSADRIDLFDGRGSLAGWYLIKTNTTFDRRGAYFGSGNLLGMLLCCDADSKKKP